MVIFTEAIAAELIRRGFKLIGYTDKSWEFEDSVRLEAAVDELLAAFEEVDR